MPLVTILALEMRSKFFQLDQRLEMVRVALVTILAQKMRLKFFEVDQRLEMLRVALVTTLAREMRLNFFEVDQALEMLRVPLVTIVAREMRSNVFSSRPTFGDVASAASHDIGARNAIESFFNSIWCQTANNVTSRARKISLRHHDRARNWTFDENHFLVSS